jgi:hypothetical protein
MRAVLAVLAALLMTGVAAAQTEPPPSAETTDPAGDAGGPLDVRRVTMVRATKDRLRAEIAMQDAWSANELRGGTRGPGSICVRLWTRRDASAEPPDWLVCAMPARSGDALVGRVLRETEDGLPRRVARATVTRPTDRTVHLRFTERAIRRPRRLRFSAEAVSRGTGCARRLGCRDLAPRAPRTVALALPRA